MGSIPVAGTKKGEPPLWLAFFGTHTPNPSPQTECSGIGFASCELARRELVHSRREQRYSRQRNSRCGSPFLAPAHRTHLRKQSVAELGSHLASLPDGSLFTVGASKDIRDNEIPVVEYSYQKYSIDRNRVL